MFEGIQKAVAADRYAFFTEFFKNFYNTDVFLGKRISEQAVQASWNIAAGASATASLACVPTWYEDFRNDLARIDVPTLVIHGDADRIVPLAASGQRTAKLIKGARLVAIKDGPHAINWTHAEEVNDELANFLGTGLRSMQPQSPGREQLPKLIFKLPIHRRCRLSAAPSHRYTKEQIPSVNAFFSLTIYDRTRVSFPAKSTGTRSAIAAA